MNGGWRAGCVAAGLGLATLAQGRLGETGDACRARYGEIVDDTPLPGTAIRLIRYRTNGVAVGVQFESNRAVIVSYNLAAFRDDGEAVRVLLSANAAGSTWTNAGSDWTRADGGAFARYIERRLIITDAAFDARRREAADRQEKALLETLKGF